MTHYKRLPLPPAPHLFSSCRANPRYQQSSSPLSDAPAAEIFIFCVRREKPAGLWPSVACSAVSRNADPFGEAHAR
ncbi:hypothetical protein XENTR_v10017398 [Xenopus tropicalis]|nr:hypothetical protein XENTR_v10017398 [Xenopus tropicalis]